VATEAYAICARRNRAAGCPRGGGAGWRGGGAAEGSYEQEAAVVVGEDKEMEP
jgi:hypothetical protein